MREVWLAQLTSLDWGGCDKVTGNAKLANREVLCSLRLSRSRLLPCCPAARGSDLAPLVTFVLLPRWPLALPLAALLRATRSCNSTTGSDPVAAAPSVRFLPRGVPPPRFRCAMAAFLLLPFSSVSIPPPAHSCNNARVVWQILTPACVVLLRPVGYFVPLSPPHFHSGDTEAGCYLP